MGTKNNPGKFDCYAKLEPNEPYFTLRGKDPLASDMVRLWIELACGEYDRAKWCLERLIKTAIEIPHNLSYGQEKFYEAIACSIDMYEWQDKLRTISKQERQNFYERNRETIDHHIIDTIYEDKFLNKDVEVLIYKVYAGSSDVWKCEIIQVTKDFKQAFTVASVHKHSFITTERVVMFSRDMDLRTE